MGNFSWCTSDTKKSIACAYSGYEGAPKTVYMLNPFGEPYKETYYEGYGVFGGRDVYELVAEWNRPYLSVANISCPERSEWPRGREGWEHYRAALDSYEARCLRINDFVLGKSDDYMKDRYGYDWKRLIGIDIACDDRDHVKLRYPIKLVEKPCDYEKADISPSCPFQGYFYDEVFDVQHSQAIVRSFEELLKERCEYAEQQADALDNFFAGQHMDDCYIDETYPHLIVKDDEGNVWKDAAVYEFVLNECLGFNEDGSLQFGFGATSQTLAETLKAHARSYGVVVTPYKKSLEERISEAESLKVNERTALDSAEPERE